MQKGDVAPNRGVAEDATGLPAGAAADAGPPRTPAGAMVRGCLLVFIDTFVLNQGAIAVIVGLWVVLLSLPRVLLTHRWREHRRTGLVVVGIYLAAVAAVLSLNAAFNGMARERAEIVVAAVKARHAEIGAYPATLEELVPDYLPAVPRTKPVLGFNTFLYRNEAGSTMLMYTDLPPFGRPYFDFARDAWDYLD